MNRNEDFDPFKHIDNPNPDVDPFGDDREVKKASREVYPVGSEHRGENGRHTNFRELGRLPFIGTPIDQLTTRRGRHVADSEEQ